LRALRKTEIARQPGEESNRLKHSFFLSATFLARTVTPIHWLESVLPIGSSDQCCDSVNNFVKEIGEKTVNFDLNCRQNRNIGFQEKFSQKLFKPPKIGTCNIGSRKS
jgi:hypothetical protein